MKKIVVTVALVLVCLISGCVTTSLPERNDARRAPLDCLA